MIREPFTGAWYGDAVRLDRAILYGGSRIETASVTLTLPTGGDVLYTRVAVRDGNTYVSGQGHDDGRAWLWSGGAWHALTPVNGTHGLSPCCFGTLGLYVSTPGAERQVKVFDVVTGVLLLEITKAVGSRGIAAVTGAGTTAADVHSVDEWYGAWGLAEYVELANGMRVGQGAGGGIVVRDGPATHLIEPGNAKFVRASLDAGVVTAAAWKDEQPSSAVVVTFTEAEMRPIMRDPRFWLHPNIASVDLLQLLDRPDLLANVGVFGLYVQEVLYEDASQGPNTASALVAHDVYRKLLAQQIALNVEMGSVKPSDCEAKNAVKNLEQCLTVVTDHGGRVDYLTQDEPLTAWVDSCSSRTLEQVADSVAAFMQRATALGVPHVGLAEAWPHVGFATQQQFLDLLAARGCVPSHWAPDIDYHAAGQQGKNVAAFIQAAQALAESRGIVLSLLVNATVDPITPDQKHFDNLAALARQLEGISSRPARVVVQSWARRVTNGPQDVPNNIGPASLTASFADTLAVFGVTPPTGPTDPAPPTGGAGMQSTTIIDKPPIAVKEVRPVEGKTGLFSLILTDGYTYSMQPARPGYPPADDVRPNDGSSPDTYKPGQWETCTVDGSLATFYPNGAYLSRWFVRVGGL